MSEQESPDAALMTGACFDVVEVVLVVVVVVLVVALVVADVDLTITCADLFLYITYLHQKLNL